MALYTFVGTSKPSYHVDKIIVGDKEILLGVPIDLTEDEYASVARDSLIFEKTSAVESEAVQSAISDWEEEEILSTDDVGDDDDGNFPLLGGLFNKDSAKSGNDPHKEVN